MLKKISFGIAALILIFLGLVLMQPARYHVERSQVIEAPAELVWAEISDFSSWKGWSHWEKSDPSQKTIITGAPGQVGHKTVWEGEKTGQGSMSVTQAAAPKQLGIALRFKEPMSSEAVTEFNLVSVEEGTKITWSMDGENGFMGKLFGLLMSMDQMIGLAYENSLRDLKVLVEEKAKALETGLAAPSEAAPPSSAAAVAGEAAPGAEE